MDCFEISVFLERGVPKQEFKVSGSWLVLWSVQLLACNGTEKLKKLEFLTSSLYLP